MIGISEVGAKNIMNNAYNTILLNDQPYGRYNPFNESSGSIPMEDVIDSSGNLIPFEKVRENVDISEDHYLSISNFLSLLHKKTILSILKEKQS